jgi:hypothetical protein
VQGSLLLRMGVCFELGMDGGRQLCRQSIYRERPTRITNRTEKMNKPNHGIQGVCSWGAYESMEMLWTHLTTTYGRGHDPTRNRNRA